MLVTLALLVLPLQESAVGDSARVVAVQAARAVEGDSVARVTARWTARRKRNPGDRLATLGLGYVAQLQYRYAEAERLGRSVATREPDALGARGFLLVAASLATRAQYPAADSALGTAMRIAGAAGDTTALAEAMIALSTTRLRTIGVAAADSMLTQAAALVGPDDTRSLASLRCARALLLATRSRAEARQEALAAADLARRAGETRLQASCLTVVAQDWIRVGRADSAGAVFDQVLALQRKARDRAGAAITLQWSGYLRSTIGEYIGALRYLREAVDEGTAVGNPAPVAWASLSLASIATGFGDVNEAVSHAARARAMFERSGDQLGASNALGTMGDVARAAGHVARARSLYEEAMRRARLDGRAQAEMSLQRGLADLSLMEGDVERAAAEHERATVIARRAGLKGWEQSGAAFGALVALRRGRLDDAERQLRTLDRVEVQQGRAYMSRVMLAELLARRGITDSAGAVLTLAMDEIDRWRRTLSDRQLRLAVFEPRLYWSDPDLGVATVISHLASAGRPALAFELTERRRARDLRDRLVRDDALADSAASRTYRLSARDAMRHRSRFALDHAVTADEVAAALPDEHTALLEYATGRVNEPTTLFVVTRTGLVVHRLPSIDSLAPHVARFVRHAEGGVASPVLAASLGAALLAPAIAALPTGIHRLVIVPDDILHRVPFDAVVVGGSPVLERFETSTMPSAAVARELWRRPARTDTGTILAFGDPAFAGRASLEGGPAAAFAASNGLAPLPYSSEEVRDIASRFRGTVVRTRRDASEAWLKRASLGTHAVLHFATHAWVDDRSVNRTALALAPGEGDDGFVIPADLAVLDLDADVVVLSACGTGGGVVVRGEGLMGLTAPLLEAGGRAVVATRWRVGDRATARLVTDFYREIARGTAAGASLRSAKRTARRRGAPVSEWAAFTLVGDPVVRPRLAPTS